MKTHDFSQGVQALFRGFKMLGDKRLWHLIAMPILINALLFIAFFALVWKWLNTFITGLNQQLPSWLFWLDWLIWLLFVFAGLIVLIYLFTFFANLIGAPFYGLLAEKAEKIHTAKEIEGISGIRGFFKLIPYVLKQQWYIIWYYLPRAVLCIVLFFIPIVQLAAPFIWFLLNAWMMNIQYMSYPMENHQLSFAVMKAKFRQRRSLSLGFGSMVMLGMLIPILNLFVMPAAALGGTLLWLEHYSDAKTE